MRLFWVCVIAVIIVLGLYVAIHRILINRATIMLRNQAQATTDRAVNNCLARLLKWDRHLSSQLVADVWGKGVLAFEYHFNYDPAEMTLNREDLSKQLNAYAKDHQIDSLKTGKPAFVVTDWWTYEQILHIDVAYLLNEATVEYVADLKKLDKHNGK